MYRLIHLNGESKGRRQAVHRRRILVGSDHGCLLWIAEDGVAPQQAELLEEDGGVRIRSLAVPSDGVRVNGETTHEALLRHGDRFEIGSRGFRVDIRSRARRGQKRRAALLALLALALIRPAWRAWQPTPPPPDPVETARAPDPAAFRELFERPAPALDQMEVLDRLLEETRPERPDPSPAPTDPADAVPGVHSPDELEAERLRRMEAILGNATAAIAREEFDDAHGILGRLQAAAPAFLPAHAERARLYERQGRTFEAERHWMRILQQGIADPLFHEAAEALSRLAVFEPPPAHEPAPRARPETPAPRPVPRARIRIAATEPARFPSAGEFDEMRIIRFTLVAEGPAPPEHNVTLDVRFFDRMLPSQAVQPTRAIAPRERVPVTDGPWPAQGKVVGVTYLVPTGQRDVQRRETGQQAEYAGFVARVYAGRELQDETARPRALLAFIDGSP